MNRHIADVRPTVNSDGQHGVNDQHCGEINVELDGDADTEEDARDGGDLIGADSDDSGSECSLGERQTRDRRPPRWLADFDVS